MKKLSLMLAVMLTVVFTAGSALACSSIYVGSALTDGSTYFGRSEDYANSRNKLMYVSPAGNHKAGEEYSGCYGFTYTFTHDSYSYTAFSDDNQEGAENVCPNCGQTHAHTPYEAGGTNEMGVTISATETLYGSEAAAAADPYEDAGIEEAEITTVILSEAATAKEGVELLTKIYAETGCNGASGIFIADNTEVWYIENLSGHSYVAVKLAADAVLAEPNMSIIGAIDLDDTENVIASQGLIELAKKGGFFVGDEEANVINYSASFNPEGTANSRMKNALQYFNAEYDFSESDPAFELYAVTNVDAEGNIVAPKTGIVLDRTFTAADVINYYHIAGIGSVRNLETHVFQLSEEDGKTDTIEWVAMDDATCNVFVPYYPMLTTDTDASLKLSTATAVFTEEEPTEGVYYATTKRTRVDGEVVTLEGFCSLPANWADSMYWSIDAISNLVASGNLTEEQIAAVHEAMDAQQQKVYDAFTTTKANVAAAASEEEAAKIATADSMAMVDELHQLAVKLVGDVTAE